MSDSAPALGISYSINLDKNAMRGLVFQTYVPVAASTNEINEVLDKIRTAGDRQFAIMQVMEAERALAEHQAKAAEIEGQLILVEEIAKARWAQSGRKGTWSPERLDARERQEYLAAQASHTKWREGALLYQRDLERYKPLVNGHAPDSSANNHTG